MATVTVARPYDGTLVEVPLDRSAMFPLPDLTALFYDPSEWDRFPCEDPHCGSTCELHQRGCGMAAYMRWVEAELERGDLAFVPDTMGCYECGGFDGVTAPERRVVSLGPVVEQRRDPTQSYRLECGHTTI